MIKYEIIQESETKHYLKISADTREQLELIRNRLVLKEPVSDLFVKMSSQAVIDTCLNYFNRTFDEIFRSSRQRSIVDIRHIILFMLFKFSDESQLQIEKKFKDELKISGFDHTNQIHSVKKIENILSQDSKIEFHVNNLFKIFELK